MSIYLVFFVLGFLTDKIRIFPFVLGIILGIILRSVLEDASVDSIPAFGTQLYHSVITLYTGSNEIDEKQND